MTEPVYDVIAQTDGLRMVLITLAPGQEVPWHWHRESKDTFIGMEGQVQIETDDGAAPATLLPGQLLSVEAGVRHRVAGRDGCACRVAVLQGVGRYDLNTMG